MNDPRFTADDLLGHVYGALDDDRAAALERALGRSSELRAELDRARADAAVLADAARLDAGDLVFSPPPANGRGGLLIAWPAMLAAAVVLALVAIGVDLIRSRRVLVDEDPVREVADELARTPGSESIDRLFANLVGRLAAREPTTMRARVSTDKPIYRPGEAIRVRAVALDRVALTPRRDIPMIVRLVAPAGSTVSERHVQAAPGVAGLDLALPADASGGEYHVTLSHPTGAFPETDRRITVATYREPTLETDLELDRDSYRPGGNGHALLTMTRATGEIPAGASINAAIVTGDRTWSHTYTLPADGRLTVPFTVPANAETGCFLSLAVDDGGRVETLTKTVPIVLDRVVAKLYPEGGELVAGLPGRVYYRIRDPHGARADLDALVVDSSGRTVAETRVEVEGMGAFDLTPVAGETYRLVARGGRPEIAHDALTPVIDGVALRSLGETEDGRLRVRLASTEAGPHRVVATCRTAPLAETTVDIAANTVVECTLTPTRELGGVVRVTVLDPSGTPRAERLVARAPPRRLDLAVETDRPAYAPREEVRVTVAARDERGAPAPGAVLGVACVDRATRALARDEDTTSHPLHFLLGLDVDEIENAALYGFDAASARAVDLLLGVQGWRRFVGAPRPLFVPASHDPAGDGAERRTELERQTWARIALVLLAAGLGGLFLSVRRPPSALTRSSLLAVTLAGLAMLATVPVARERGSPGESRSADAIALALATETFGADWPSTLREQGSVFDFRVVDVPDFVTLDLLSKRPLRISSLARLRIEGALREYARDRPAIGESTARHDFADVLYWNPLLIADEHGVASFSFTTSDRLTTFAVAVDAHDARGALGAGEGSFTNVAAFSVDFTTPPELGTGDVAKVAFDVSRRSSENAAAPVTCTIESPASVDRVGGLEAVALAANQPRVRSYLTFRAIEPASDARLRVTGVLGEAHDAVVRRLRIVPRGYPHRESRAGVLGTRAAFDVTLPADAAGVDATLRLYPSPLAALNEGLDAMLAEPGGCFEQVASTTYPNAMVLAWLSEQGAPAPDVTRRAKELLAKGLRLMEGHACPSGGFEWFGDDPGHEALTAYGLLQLADIAAVHPVDRGFVDRAHRWLLSRRDGEGGYRYSEGRYGFRASLVPEEISHAYVTWALAGTTEGEDEGETPLAPELARLEANAAGSDDPYLLALTARALAGAGVESAAELRARLASLANDDGSFTGTRTSITASGGSNLTVETTALAVLALAGDARHGDVVDRAVDALLAARRDGGTFGATQATVLAMKALLAAATDAPDAPADRHVAIRVNGDDVATIVVPRNARGALAAPIGPSLRPGVNRVELRVERGGRLPWSATIGYRGPAPRPLPEAPLAVTTKLAAATVREGDTVRAEVTVTNRRDAVLPMTLVRVGLPAGLEPRLDQLKELRRRGEVAFWETRPREVTLYWRGLGAQETKRVALDLIAATAGTYEGPASCAYLYYDDDAKSWAEPLRSEILTR